MKIRGIFAKIILSMLLLLVTLTAFFLLGIAVHAVPAKWLSASVLAMYSGIGVSFSIAGVAILLLALVAGYILLDKGKVSGNAITPSAVISMGEDGSVFISLAAIDSIVQKECRSCSGVKECDSIVTNVENGICIGVRLDVTAQADIQTMTVLLRQNLKDKVEGWTGISVRSVEVFVEKILEPVPVNNVPASGE